MVDYLVNHIVLIYLNLWLISINRIIFQKNCNDLRLEIGAIHTGLHGHWVTVLDPKTLERLLAEFGLYKLTCALFI